MAEWRDVTLGDLEREAGGSIQTGPFGSQLHMSDYSATGTPVVMPTNIKDLRIDASGIARVSDDHVERLARHRLRPGDIIYSRRGDVEKCALITDGESGWLCGSGCLLVRVGGNSADPRFLSYALSLPETRSWIAQHAVGATMPNLNTSILREVPLRTPRIETQRAIATTLGALDDKIESNRRLAGTAADLIDAMARRLVLAHESECLTLREVVQFNANTVRPGQPHDEIAYIDIASVSPGEIATIPYLTWADAPSRARRGVVDGDVMYSTVRPGRRSFAQILDPDPRTVVSTGFAVMTPSSEIGSSFLTSVAGSLEFSEYLESVAHGSAYPAVSVEAMGQYRLRLPPAGVMEQFEAATMPLRRRVQLARQESASLAALRDALLPELLSGRIRVSEVRESIEESIDDEVPHG